MRKKYFILAKITIVAFIAILLVSLINSCGSKKDNVNSENKITFWHFWSEPNQKKILKELIKEFEAANNCTVETTELSWNDGKIKLFAAFNSNTAPDIMDLGSDWIAQFSGSGILTELNPNTYNISRFSTFFLEPAYWEAKLFAVPWVVNSRVLFYNKELFKKAGLGEDAPKTLQDLYNYAEKISAIPGVYGFGVNGSDPHRLYKKIIPFMWTMGGEIIDKNGNLVLSSQPNAQAFDFYQKLSQVGLIETQKKLDDMFARGEIGLWLSGSWLLDKIRDVNPLLNYGVCLFPGVDAGKPGVSFGGGEYLAINKSTKNKALSEKLIAFLTKGENALKFCKDVKEAGFPADMNFYYDKYYQTLPFMPIFADQLKYSRITPVHPKWLDLETAIENAVVEVLYGKKGSWEALNEVQQSMEAIIRK